MIVDPTFTRSPKIRALGRDLKDKMVHIYVLNLWGYCQTQMTDEVPSDPNLVSEICEYGGNPETFLQLLLARRVLEAIPGGNLRVHEWRQYNASLWRNWKNGKNHGRKPKSTNPDETQDEPRGNPEGTQREPRDNPRATPGGGDMIRLDKSIPPNPQGGLCGWVGDLLSGLVGTGKFPALTAEGIRVAARGYPRSGIESRWGEVVTEAENMPAGVIQNPLAWLRRKLSRMELEGGAASSPEDGAAENPEKQKAGDVFVPYGERKSDEW